MTELQLLKECDGTHYYIACMKKDEHNQVNKVVAELRFRQYASEFDETHLNADNRGFPDYPFGLTMEGQSIATFPQKLDNVLDECEKKFLWPSL